MIRGNDPILLTPGRPAERFIKMDQNGGNFNRGVCAKFFDLLVLDVCPLGLALHAQD